MHVLEPQPNEDGEVILFKKAWLPAGPNESVTVMVKLSVTAALCAPEITPQEHLSVVAVGKAPEGPPKVYGRVPTLRRLSREYASSFYIYRGTFSRSPEKPEVSEP